MSPAFRQSLTWIASESTLCGQLVSDPKGTVLYVLPPRLEREGLGLSPDDQLDLVGLSESFTEDKLRGVAQALLRDPKG